MPRPPVKRSKPNQPNRAAKRAPSTLPSSSPAARRRQLRDQLAHKQIGRVPHDSDDSDLLVTKSKGTRHKRGVPRQEVYGSGGVAQGDQVAAHQSTARNRTSLTAVRTSTAGSQANGFRNAATRPSRDTRAATQFSTSETAEASTRARKSPKTSSSGLTSLGTPSLSNRDTPSAGTSILGPLRIRKRQASILQVIDAPDSAILDQDIDEFLPNDESTPLNGTRKRKLSTPPIEVDSAPSALSRPRSATEGSTSREITNAELDLPPPLSSVASPNRPALSDIDGDTLALPRSSSPDPSPVKAKAPSPSKDKVDMRKRKEPELSTSALQALMPTRRNHRPRRDRTAKRVSKFDIPEDSSASQGPEADAKRRDVDTEESYIVTPKRVGSRRGGASAKLQKSKKPSSRIRKPDSKQTLAGRGGIGSRTRKASTQSPSLTRATASSSAAKRSQQRRPSTVDHPATTYSQDATVGSPKSSGAQADSEDKENRPSDSFANSSKQAMEGAPGPIPASEDEHEDVEVGKTGVGFALNDDDREDLQLERERLAQKFKEVDEWEMEFEDGAFNEESDPLSR